MVQTLLNYVQGNSQPSTPACKSAANVMEAPRLQNIDAEPERGSMLEYLDRFRNSGERLNAIRSEKQACGSELRQLA